MNDVYQQALAAYQADPTQSQRAVAAQFGISQPTLNRLIHRNAVDVNKVSYPGCHDHKRETALAMIEQGMSYAAVGRAVGCNYVVVKRWVEEAADIKPQPAPAEPIILTVIEPIQPWEDSGEVIHMGNLGRVLAEQYGQAWEDDE